MFPEFNQVGGKTASLIQEQDKAVWHQNVLECPSLFSLTSTAKNLTCLLILQKFVFYSTVKWSIFNKHSAYDGHFTYYLILCNTEKFVTERLKEVKWCSQVTQLLRGRFRWTQDYLLSYAHILITENPLFKNITSANLGFHRPTFKSSLSSLFGPVSSAISCGWSVRTLPAWMVDNTMT